MLVRVVKIVFKLVLVVKIVFKLVLAVKIVLVLVVKIVFTLVIVVKIVLVINTPDPVLVSNTVLEVPLLSVTEETVVVAIEII